MKIRRPNLRGAETRFAPDAGIATTALVLGYARRLLAALPLQTELVRVAIAPLTDRARERLVALLPATEPEARRRSRRIFEASPGDLADLAYELVRNATPPSARIGSRELKSRLDDVLTECELDLPATDPEKSAELAFLRATFRLDAVETDLVVFCYCLMQHPPLLEFFSGLSIQDAVYCAGIACSLSPAEIRAAISTQGRLVRCGLLCDDNYPLELPLTLDASIAGFLSGLGGPTLSRRFARRNTEPGFALATFTVDDLATDIVRQLLQSEAPTHILLYGKAGTGKTEYARAVAQASGREVLFLQYEDEERGRHGSRIIGLQIALQIAESENAVLVIDEAEPFLGGKGEAFAGLAGILGPSFENRNDADKSWINDLLDRTHTRTVWIVNRTTGIDESTRRRFAYSIEFSDFTPRQRENLWHTILAGHPLADRFSAATVLRLATSLPVNAGGIAGTLSALAALAANPAWEPERSIELAEELLGRHLALAGRQNMPTGALNVLTDDYDLSVVNADSDPARTVLALKMWQEKNAGLSRRKRVGAHLLFWGEPGTGKTEYAKYIARELGMMLHVHRASDLLHPHVGMTEQKIRHAFEQALSENAILFIDEADSFLGSRERARASWEVTLVNEMLCQIENFSGLIVCCTNLVASLDHAVLRRFHWKIEFRPLTGAGCLTLFEKTFGREGWQLDPATRKNLVAQDGLTPGDFKAVATRLRYLEPGDISSDGIIDELASEKRYRTLGAGSRRVGFTET